MTHVRGVFTLVGAGTAGLLVWIATQIGTGYTGGYWAVYGLFAGAGLALALSQLFGGWTKWGVPRVSLSVFVVGFVPALVCAGWVLLAGQPDANWFQRHVVSWSGDIGITGLVDDLRSYLAVLALGLGLVFGFTFDTAGPRARVQPASAPIPAEPEPLPAPVPASPATMPPVAQPAPVSDEPSPLASGIVQRRRKGDTPAMAAATETTARRRGLDLLLWHCELGGRPWQPPALDRLRSELGRELARRLTIALGPQPARSRWR